MSGIAGIVNVDGSPIDRRLLLRMAQHMRYRGPDAQEIWLDGQAGFAHVKLATTCEQERETQPFTTDGRVWITADARIDARAELIGKLKAHGRSHANAATDIELILDAYHCWGEDCLQYLLGDFAFAIWDASRRRLFCARDHFGVKLFYYARVANCFVFSNTLNCVRTHPAVRNTLNDQAIGDFLLFGYNPVLSTTTFSDIQRLPPAHSLSLSASGMQVRRYWSLPRDGDLIRYKNPGDYIDRFKELLREAVVDRLRTNRIGILMSGGMDSTALAALTCELRARHGTPADIRAYCCVYDRLPDDERHYSGLVAGRLGVPIEYLVLDDFPQFKDWDCKEWLPPEPYDSLLMAIDRGLLGMVAAQNRVVLFGEDGDALLSSSSVLEMLKTMPMGRVVADVARYCLKYRRRPRFGLGILAKARRLVDGYLEVAYPSWLNKGFAARYDLTARWNEKMKGKTSQVAPLRESAYSRLTSSLWQTVFESCDPGVTHYPVEHRLPLLDLRVVAFALALPPLPWRENKELLRAAMRGMLPEEVCRRPKTPLRFDPDAARLRRTDAQWIDDFLPAQELALYVNRAAVPKLTGEAQQGHRADVHLRPLLLNLWLQSAVRFGNFR